MSDDLVGLSAAMREGVAIQTRKYHLVSYEKSFLGKEAVEWLITNNHAKDVEEAEFLGGAMMEMGLFRHVLDSEDFKNDKFFYRFKEDAGQGEVKKKNDGSSYSWADIIRKNVFTDNTNSHNDNLLSSIPDPSQDTTGVTSHLDITPMDEHNIKLLDNVHPPKWQNPQTEDTYNLVAIGAGAGGLVATGAGAAVMAKCAIIEKHLMGGDCLNVGCVPSKALIKAARVAHYCRNGHEYGITATGVEVDFAKVMERMRKIRTQISPADSADKKVKQGVDVYVGNGVFLDANTIEVTGDDGEKRLLRFKKAVIATGGRPSVPPIPGLADTPFTTNLSLYNLTVLPPRMCVIGAGPIGLEMAQAFGRFGSQVTVLVRDTKILPREDADAATIVRDQLIKDGLKLEFGLKFVKVTHSPKAEGKDFPEITVHVEQNGESKEFVCDVLLVATGRKPNVEGIGLEKAGVEFNVHSGVKINDRMQTSQSHIYAVGDCCMKYQFTHVAGTQGGLVMRNALLYGRSTVSSMLIPWVTYTEPEVAHVGLYEHDLEQRGIKFDTFSSTMEHNDRAICEGETEGFVKIHVKQGTDKILGATIVAASAGEMISEISVAMQNGLGLAAISGVIHPYPTQAEGIRTAALAYQFSRFKPFFKAILKSLMSWQRS